MRTAVMIASVLLAALLGLAGCAASSSSSSDNSQSAGSSNNASNASSASGSGGQSLATLPQKGDYLYEALGDEKLANIKAEPPVKLKFHIDQGGFGRTAILKEGGALDQAVQLLCDIKIGEETDEMVTDNYNYIELTWADGTTTGIRLNLYNLEYSAQPNKFHIYRLENLDPFWTYCANRATEGDYLAQDA